MIAEVTDRREHLRGFLAQTLGLSLDAYADFCVNRLLEALPPAFDDADEEVMRRLIATCSIGETTFLRHPEHFSILREFAADPLRGDRPVRAWSAGCATGEEAYSIAAVLQQAGRVSPVLGTDMNDEFLQRAVQGGYRLWSLRGVNDLSTVPWLRVAGLDVQVADEVRQQVTFRRLNLHVDPYEGPFDVIFCRNVLMYFCPESGRQVLRRLADQLTEGGLLFLGYTDPSPDEAVGLVPLVRNGVRYFCKCSAPETQSTGHPLVEGAVATASVNGRQVMSRPAAAFQPSKTLDPENAVTPGGRFEQRLNLVRGLTQQMCFDEALAQLESVYHDYPLEVEPAILLALIAEEAGRLQLAVQAARRACFLAPEVPMAQYMLGCCLWRSGRQEQAARRFRAALRILRQSKGSKEPLAFGQGLTGIQLERILHGYVE